MEPNRYNDLSEKELFQLWLTAEDQLAATELYRRRCGSVRKIFRDKGFCPDDADDGAQETFRRFFSSKSYNQDKNLLSWLYAIARRVAIDIANENRRARGQEKQTERKEP